MKYCEACGNTYQICKHHIKTKKAHPHLKDKEWNLINLCFAHHNQIHSYGLNRFILNYPRIIDVIKKKGWSKDKFLNKWVHEE